MKIPSLIVYFCVLIEGLNGRLLSATDGTTKITGVIWNSVILNNHFSSIAEVNLDKVDKTRWSL